MSQGNPKVRCICGKRTRLHFCHVCGRDLRQLRELRQTCIDESAVRYKLAQLAQDARKPVQGSVAAPEAQTALQGGNTCETGLGSRTVHIIDPHKPQRDAALAQYQQLVDWKPETNRFLDAMDAAGAWLEARPMFGAACMVVGGVGAAAVIYLLMMVGK